MDFDVFGLLRSSFGAREQHFCCIIAQLVPKCRPRAGLLVYQGRNAAFSVPIKQTSVFPLPELP
jgi:hypothetical protein